MKLHFGIFLSIAPLLGLVTFVKAQVPAGAITIGSGGTYATIAAALKDTSRLVSCSPRRSELTR
jgi:hypothetical protein